MIDKEFKIIMLDMDGVVNSSTHVNNWISNKREEYKKQYPEYDILGNEIFQLTRKAYQKEFNHMMELIFPDLAERITRICNETNCYIVWSSTWRKLNEYKDIEVAKEMFNRRGLPGDRLIGYTPQQGMSWNGRCRGNEIRLWIQDNIYGKVTKCAVIDDRDDAGYNLPECAKFFQTNDQVGITEDNVEDIITYLKED
jgi:hypothetical protein